MLRRGRKDLLVVVTLSAAETDDERAHAYADQGNGQCCTYGVDEQHSILGEANESTGIRNGTVAQLNLQLEEGVLQSVLIDDVHR